MVTIAPEPARAPNGFADEATDASDADFKPMSADEAREWRAAQPPMSPWPVVWVQAAAGLVVVALAWAVSAGKMPVTQSTAYGALAAWLPAVLFARLVARRMRLQANAGSALMALMVGEGIKVVLTVALLLAAPKVLTQVHWLALLAGFVMTIKAAWVALWLMSARRRGSTTGLTLEQLVTYGC
jgi:ATP synthase protein I